MRKYALVVLDNKDEILDRYNFDVTTDPTGNGFELSLYKIEDDVKDIITKVVQKKGAVTFVVNQIQESYQKSNVLADWIQKYSTTDSVMALEYDDGTGVVRYCEGKVTKLEKTENQYKNVLQQRLEFTQTSPYYISRKNTITIQVSSQGKSYPYRYPYSYGSSKIENNEIENPYIMDIPLIITIKGKINNTTISLLDENNDAYTSVEIDQIIETGETLIINSAQRKIVKISANGVESDFVPYVSPSTDTFLMAKSGKSKININTSPDNIGDGFSLTGSWRQYNL